MIFDELKVQRFHNFIVGEVSRLRSREAFCLRMLSRGSFYLKNRWYTPAPRVRVHFPLIFKYPKCKTETKLWRSSREILLG